MLFNWVLDFFFVVSCVWLAGWYLWTRSKIYEKKSAKNFTQKNQRALIRLLRNVLFFGLHLKTKKAISFFHFCCSVVQHLSPFHPFSAYFWCASYFIVQFSYSKDFFFILHFKVTFLPQFIFTFHESTIIASRTRSRCAGKKRQKFAITFLFFIIDVFMTSVEITEAAAAAPRGTEVPPTH